MTTEEEKRPLEAKSPRQIDIPVPINVLYINGATVGLSPTEIQITASLNGRPAVQLFIPFPAAKSIALAIQDAVRDHESRSGTKVLELREMLDYYKK